MKQDFYLNWHLILLRIIFVTLPLFYKAWIKTMNMNFSIYFNGWNSDHSCQEAKFAVLPSFFPGDLKEEGLTGKQSDIWLHEEMQQKEIPYTNCKLKKEKQKSFVNAEIALETYALCPKVPVPSWCRKITGWLWTSLVERSGKGGQAPLFLM